MILLTRMDKQLFFLNPDHIVSIEETPDTVITLFNDHHFIVRDSARAIIEKIISFRAGIIRRSGVSVEKKYLRKARRELFGPAYSTEKSQPQKKSYTPFHSQDS